MPKIIWCGNKSWDTDFPENTLPNNAKRIERPDNIFKSSLLYGILPLIFSYAIIWIKWFIIGETAMNPIYVPFKAMNRRGCRRAYTWKGFVEMLKYYPLAKPKTYYCLY